jgi:hypothetical protein
VAKREPEGSLGPRIAIRHGFLYAHPGKSGGNFVSEVKLP